RYAFLPVVKVDDLGAGFGVSFQLDEASLAYAQANGATVRYRFRVEVWNIQRNTFSADNHFLESSQNLVNTTGALTLGEGDVIDYAAQDRMVVVSGIAQLMK